MRGGGDITAWNLFRPTVVTMLQHQSTGTCQRSPDRRACLARGIFRGARCGTYSTARPDCHWFAGSILTFFAFNRVAVQFGAMLKPYCLDLYEANGETIKTFGMAECVRFKLGGYELETNFVVMDDAMSLEDSYWVATF